ncbi:MAG: Rab family GTPase [Candidatus Odinarchaeia archaeon]
MQSSNSGEAQFVFKVLLLGDGAVGKTSLISMFTKGFIKQDYKMTIGVDIMTKTVEVDGNVAKLSIWDLAGQQRFKAIRSAFYGGVAGALLVFDLTRALTFKNLVSWLQELYQFGCPDCPVILIGNKVDLPELRDVKPEDIEWFSNEIGCEYLETSAKTGENVEDAFKLLTRKMIERSTGKKVKIIREEEEGKCYTRVQEDTEENIQDKDTSVQPTELNQSQPADDSQQYQTNREPWNFE